MDLDQTLCPNSREVAAKVMDGEAVLINLNTGVYYSTAGCGGFLWDLLERGYTPRDCLNELTARFTTSREQAEADLAGYLAELLAESLVVAGPVEKRPLEPPQGQEKADYSAPLLHAYRDMGDLLALDPPAPDLDLAP